MHRFYVETPIAAAGERVTLSPEESRHAARVLRLRPGETVCLLDGQGLWEAALETVAEEAAVAVVTAQHPSPESDTKVVLWQGLPKADKLEWIAQKATELGADALWPVEMERSVARADKGGRDEKKRERLQRIALEAAKQSGRARVMQVAPTVPMAQAVQRLVSDPAQLVLVAWEEEHALPLSEAVREHVVAHGAPERAVIVIGPEGGISRQEWERLQALGARSVTLGRRILRTETAGLCALSVLWAALGEM